MVQARDFGLPSCVRRGGLAHAILESLLQQSPPLMRPTDLRLEAHGLMLVHAVWFWLAPAPTASRGQAPPAQMARSLPRFDAATASQGHDPGQFAGFGPAARHGHRGRPHDCNLRWTKDPFEVRMIAVERMHAGRPRLTTTISTPARMRIAG